MTTTMLGYGILSSLAYIVANVVASALLRDRARLAREAA